MDISKLKGLVPVKKVIIDKAAVNRPRNRTIKQTPHAIKCEVFLFENKVYGIIDNDRHLIDITNQDYLEAEYAFSTPENEHWDWYTIRSFAATEENVEELKHYWQLVAPKMKVWITLENGVGKLCMDRLNARNAKVYSRLSPKYYANRRN